MTAVATKLSDFCPQCERVVREDEERNETVDSRGFAVVYHESCHAQWLGNACAECGSSFDTTQVCQAKHRSHHPTKAEGLEYCYMCCPHMPEDVRLKGICNDCGEKADDCDC